MRRAARLHGYLAGREVYERFLELGAAELLLQDFVSLLIQSDQNKNGFGDVDPQYANLHDGSSLFPVIGVC